MTGESYLLYLSWRHAYPHEDFLLFLLLPLPSVLASSVRLSAPLACASSILPRTMQTTRVKITLVVVYCALACWFSWIQLAVRVPRPPNKVRSVVVV
jgi:hypothetical protein